ncbi:hypothetical protein RvY_10885 [Ramazzottius varieornatus]|uniref:Uncharacterized protein n=1 Tax=Ramazzottius varieornatus TaxID=947166 RepID=A0A1D1VGP5_RAMVA|nr:hypothetical protein RvY_10885 [Ramazzottius varieornatus]
MLISALLDDSLVRFPVLAPGRLQGEGSTLLLPEDSWPESLRQSYLSDELLLDAHIASAETSRAITVE